MSGDWKWKVGDVLVSARRHDVCPVTGLPYERTYREIVEVRPGSGYTWRYPHHPGDATFISENSNDQQMLWGWEKVMDDRVKKIVAAAQHAEKLAQAYHEAPTPENGVLHAVHAWRQGCTNGSPGECEECNRIFLGAIRKHLGVANG